MAVVLIVLPCSLGLKVFSSLILLNQVERLFGCLPYLKNACLSHIEALPILLGHGVPLVLWLKGWASEAQVACRWHSRRPKR